MVYMSRMPVGGKQEHSGRAKPLGDRLKESPEHIQDVQGGPNSSVEGTATLA